MHQESMITCNRHGLPHTRLLRGPTEKPGQQGRAAPAAGARFAYAVLPEAPNALCCSHTAAAGVRLDAASAGVPLLLLLAEPEIQHPLLRL